MGDSESSLKGDTVSPSSTSPLDPSWSNPVGELTFPLDPELAPRIAPTP